MFATSKYTPSTTLPRAKNGYNAKAKRYRYRFNGQEGDNEIAGVGNIMTAEFWEYDARTGTRWNTDPKNYKMQGWSPYCTNLNNPILNKDEKGDIPGIGTLIGGAAGFAKEVVGQTISNGIKNLNEGKGFLKDWNKNMDWADVAISTGEGALAGSTMGVSLLATSAISSSLKGAVDVKGDGSYKYVGAELLEGNGIHNKRTSDAIADASANFVGNLLGGGMKLDNFTKRLSGSIFQSTKNSILRRTTSGLIQGGFEGVWQLGINESKDALLNMYHNFYNSIYSIQLSTVVISSKNYKEIKEELGDKILKQVHPEQKVLAPKN
jgi:hypothetical protein